MQVYIALIFTTSNIDSYIVQAVPNLTVCKEDSLSKGAGL